MANVKKLFEVESYDEHSDILLVVISKNNESKELKINLAKFEAWLERTDRLMWEVNYADHRGAHEQVCGAVAVEDYFGEFTPDQIKNDIYEYIVINHFDFGKGLQQVFEEIQTICNEFELA